MSANSDLQVPEEFYSDLETIRKYDERLYNDLISALSDPNPINSHLELLLVQMNEALKIIQTSSGDSENVAAASSTRAIETTGKSSHLDGSGDQHLEEDSPPFFEKKLCNDIVAGQHSSPLSWLPLVIRGCVIISALLFVTLGPVPAFVTQQSPIILEALQTAWSDIWSSDWLASSPIDRIIFDVDSFSGSDSAWNDFTQYSEKQHASGSLNLFKNLLGSEEASQSIGLEVQDEKVGLGRLLASVQRFKAPSLRQFVDLLQVEPKQRDLYLQEISSTARPLFKKMEEKDEHDVDESIHRLNILLQRDLAIPVKINEIAVAKGHPRIFKFQLQPSEKSQDLCKLIWHLGSSQ